jgi:hypothetical protein
MFNPIEITPPRRRQILNDYEEEDTVRKKREDDDSWVKQLIEAVAGMLRMARK